MGMMHPMNQQNDTRQHDKQQEVYQVSTMTSCWKPYMMEISPSHIFLNTVILASVHSIN